MTGEKNDADKKKGNRVTKGSKVRNRGGDEKDNKEVGMRQTESGGDGGADGESPGLPLVVAGGWTDRRAGRGGQQTQWDVS